MAVLVLSANEWIGGALIVKREVKADTDEAAEWEDGSAELISEIPFASLLSDPRKLSITIWRTEAQHILIQKFLTQQALIAISLAG